MSERGERYAVYIQQNIQPQDEIRNTRIGIAQKLQHYQTTTT